MLVRTVPSLYRSVILLLFLSGLQAYTFVSVPLPYFASLGLLIIIPAYILKHGVVIRVPLTLPIMLWIGWLVMITLFNGIANSADFQMPPLATTPYFVFVILRFVTVTTFIFSVYAIYLLSVYGYKDRIMRSIFIMGVIVALYALYVYAAQTLGLPELPRNRVGTRGWNSQSTNFSYAFHRAMGPFREPSHLAEWLLVPLFVALSRLMSRPGLATTAGTLVIFSALLLTGSLGGILSSFLGLSVASIFVKNKGSMSFKNVWKLLLALGLSLSLFYLMAVPNAGGGIDIQNILWDRIEPILFSGEGLQASNRAHIYEYLGAQEHVWWLGSGLGNANLMLSEHRSISAVGSFLSLYLNAYFASGIVGLSLLSLGLFLPVIGAFRMRERQGSDMFWLLSAYSSFLIIFSVNSEELNIMFGVIFGLMISELRLVSQQQRNQECL